MKNIIFTLSIIFSINLLSLDIMPTDNQSVVYKEVVDLDLDLDEKKIFDAIKLFLQPSNLHRKFSLGDSKGMDIFLTKSWKMAEVEADAMNRSTRISEDSTKKIKVNFFQYFEGHSGALRTLHIDAKLLIEVKDRKYRYELSDFKWKHWNHYRGEQMSIWSTKKNCRMSGTLFQLQNLCKKASKKRKEAFVAIDKDIKLFLSDLKESVLSAKDENADKDW